MAYHVNLTELDAFITYLKKLTTELETSTADLNHYNATLHLTWRGQAATTQAQAQHTINTDLSHIHHALTTITNHTTQAHSHYTDAHTTDTSTWNAIT